MDKLAALYRPLVWLDEEILAPAVGLASSSGLVARAPSSKTA